MPGQRPRTRRARGSWLPRLAGLGAILLLAAGGAAAYLVTQHPVSRHAARLPSRVRSVETVGLVAQQAAAASPDAQLMQLLSQQGAPRFSVLTPALAAAGTPQWTADLMAGNTYIFIFLPTGRCLTATGTAHRPQLALRRCDLAAGQRWRRATAMVLARGHDFYQYANLDDSDCLTLGTPLDGQDYSATLAGCSGASPSRQLIAFWWAS